MTVPDVYTCLSGESPTFVGPYCHGGKNAAAFRPEVKYLRNFKMRLPQPLGLQRKTRDGCH